MIKIQINGRTVALTRFFSEADKAAALEFIAASPATTVVCLDTPPTPIFSQLVRELAEAGRAPIVRDHHDVTGDPKSPRDQEIRAAAEVVRAHAASGSVVSNRIANPACSSLIVAGEFATDDFIIVADADADGLTAAMKALGVTYPELDADAALLDGSPTQRQGLSSLGELLNNAGATLPPFSDRSYEGATSSLYETWALATQGETAALETLATKVARFEEMVTKAQAIATTAIELMTGVWLVDVVGQKGFHLATLTAALEAKSGCKVTVVRKDDGPIAKIGGVQYSLARHSADKETDLKSLLPSGFTSSPETGMIGNVPFLIHVSEEAWEGVVLAMRKKFLEPCGICHHSSGQIDGVDCRDCQGTGYR